MKLVLFVMLLMSSLTSVAGDIAGEANYSGKIQSVAVGFYGGVGVTLPPGETCRGQRNIVLLKTHEQYDHIFSTLLAARASQEDVNIYRLGAETSTFGVGYCVINYLSLGDFSGW
jgi:hypothetical protein